MHDCWDVWYGKFRPNTTDVRYTTFYHIAHARPALTLCRLGILIQVPDGVMESMENIDRSDPVVSQPDIPELFAYLYDEKGCAFRSQNQTLSILNHLGNTICRSNVCRMYCSAYIPYTGRHQGTHCEDAVFCILTGMFRQIGLALSAIISILQELLSSSLPSSSSSYQRSHGRYGSH